MALFCDCFRWTIPDADRFGETPLSRFLRVTSVFLLGLRDGWNGIPATEVDIVGTAAQVLGALDLAGCDLDDSLFDIKMFLDGSSNNIIIQNASLVALQQWANLLRSRGLDILQHNRSSRYGWLCLWAPERAYAGLLIACGLNVNERLDATDAGTPLIYALRAIHVAVAQDHDNVDRSTDNAISLVRAGSDIFYAYWYDCQESCYLAHHIAKWGPVMTPTICAETCGIKDIWANVLRICGYSPEEVFVEDLR